MGEQLPHSSRYGGGWQGPGAAWWLSKVSLEGEIFGMWWKNTASPAFHGDRGRCVLQPPQELLRLQGSSFGCQKQTPKKSHPRAT